ncbi:centrosome and spindle pole associated protein 1-like isoform X2 [Lampris incognitus]|uniref:centrosome and spindle pole associated protein 1-like isoform X2 n=1 Tax=Lampris incognitus TaxID=2546036 RepID=UPI0024B4FB84|nr:centrosome and spindle pole associated protein 1-like isoform X2 [Lampris incognitus]
MDDVLENFLREQKARVAEDKASLEQDPPYMEIKTQPRRADESTTKENIPPTKLSAVQWNEESYCMGLPLGVDYERKKQRLQQELRMDYRRYMAQKNCLEAGGPGRSVPLVYRRSLKENLAPHHPFLLPEHQCSPKQGTPSTKDVATLTEGSRRLRRNARAPFPNEEEEEEVLAPMERARLESPLASEEEKYTEEEEMELAEGRRRKHTGVEASWRRRSNKMGNRKDLTTLENRAFEPSGLYKAPKAYGLSQESEKDNPAGRARVGRRSRIQTDEAEFATGLMIGPSDTEEALQKRKERYRLELQEQIAEQHRNKKREKDLELKVAATGATDPEKQPDRIKQFGLSRRASQSVEPSVAGDGKLSGGLHSNERLCRGNGEREPPVQTRVAFPSPLLEYSSALGLGGGGQSPYSHSTAMPLTRAMDTTRIPMLPPHPPSTLGEAYRRLYSEVYPYPGTRNLLDPNQPYYGQLPVTSDDLPVSYWNLPQGGAHPSQLGQYSPHSQHSGSNLPEPTTQSPGRPVSENVAVDSGRVLLPSERDKSSRERMLSYKDALKQQIQERQEQRRLEQEERERYEAKLEADMKNRQPWGRGGGGAPLRDSTGNLITDLNQMHKLNEEAYSCPEQRQRRAMAAMTAHRGEQPDASDGISGFAHVQGPQFARGTVFANQSTLQQLQEQDKYKAYLKQQIEEKRRKKAEERERIKLEEEREEKRLAEQRARIQREYEEELEKKKRKEMEQKAKNEELIQLAEERRKEAERKKKEAEEKENLALRRQYEREKQARLEEVHREPSPPIPALQRRHRLPHYSPRPPTVDSQRSINPLSSPPVPACRNQLRAAEDQQEVFSKLSALRRQLRSEQKRLEGHLLQAEWEELESPPRNRHRERPLVDVFDMARLRLQAPVRRPWSRNTEPSNLLRIHDSLQLKQTEADTRTGSVEVPVGEELGGVTCQRRRADREQQHRSISQRTTSQYDYLDPLPPQQNNYLRSAMGGSARGSLLESESAFIDPMGEAFPVAPTPEQQRMPQLSARERRRLAKLAYVPQEVAISREAVGQPDSYYLKSKSSRTWEAEAARARSANKAGRLMAIRHRGDTAGAAGLSDDEGDPASPQGTFHHISMETDPWTRPGTSDTLKWLMEESSQR